MASPNFVLQLLRQLGQLFQQVGGAGVLVIVGCVSLLAGVVSPDTTRLLILGSFGLCFALVGALLLPEQWRQAAKFLLLATGATALAGRAVLREIADQPSLADSIHKAQMEALHELTARDPRGWGEDEVTEDELDEDHPVPGCEDLRRLCITDTGDAVLFRLDGGPPNYCWSAPEELRLVFYDPAAGRTVAGFTGLPLVQNKAGELTLNIPDRVNGCDRLLLRLNLAIGYW